MRRIIYLALAALMIAFLPGSAHAQASAIFSQPFQFTDFRGTGTLTVNPLSFASTRLSYQPVQVSLVQSIGVSSGSGVYHSFADDGAGLPPTVLLSFSLIDPTGSTRFYQGTLTATTINTSGSGTSWPTLSPQSASSWTAQTTSSGGTPPPSGGNQVVNSSPQLVNGWNPITFNEAIGGRYYSTYNTYSTVVSTATWSGSLASGQRSYRIEVFIPRQGSPSSVPRTSNAIYQIGGGTGTTPTALSYRANQNVSASQWITIGSAVFNGSYRIVLTDATGEASNSRSVVANAVRLTPQ
jgi:hypothetical protein